MELWNVIPNEDDNVPFILANTDRTSVSFSKRVNFDINILMSSMEERDVPFAYTKTLRLIRFTVHMHSGTYGDGEIMLKASGGCGAWFREMICQTFVHELGHHVDYLEAISDDPLVIKEKRNATHFPEPYARKNVMEYVAVGFEVFYFGSKEEKSQLKRYNKNLYRRIKQAHEKYKNK